ncbi:HD-GYP domain-containing protein [Clostridium lundense]|uniref:HD-GYP domain-containing protein n=1 Tax=Clostridium lundense TaxID=319475 RepID=UPI0004849474|nr:HD-GYP domain-containing protein [Clostridium lundense]
MTNRIVCTNVNDLVPGMIVAENIVTNNSILVSKGVEITDGIIRKLKRVYFQSTLPIYDLNDNKEDTRKSDKKTIEEVQSSVKRFSQNIENMFQHIKCDGRANMNEIRNFSKKIMNELDSPSTIVKNIVLEGSGEDCIFKHSVNVAALSLLLGKWICYDKIKLNLLVYSAILHDFGKSKIDNSILNKPTRLTEREREEIRKHPVIAYNLVKNMTLLNSSVGYGILMHHERLDGSGYPLGLKGDRINEFAKIIAIADTFDALNSDRIYRKKADPFSALEIIQRNSLGKLDYNYSKIFIEHIINYYIGERVLLNNDCICKIIHIDINNLSCPLLLSNDNFIDLKEHRNLRVTSLVID